MANLPLYIAQRGLQRQPTGARGSGVPGRVQADAAGAGQGLAVLGQSVMGVGEGLARLDQQLRAIREQTETDSVYAAGLAALEDVEGQVQGDRTIPPDERAARFEQVYGKQLVQLTASLSASGKAAVAAKLVGPINTALRGLRTQGRTETLEAAKAGLDVVLGQLRTQELRADNEVDMARIRESRAALVESYIASGVLTAEAGATRLQTERDTVQLTASTNLALVQPELALEHFRALMQGAPTSALLPTPTAEQLPKLFDLASKEADQQIVRAERARNIADKEATQRSATVRAEYITQLGTAWQNGQALQALQRQASQDQGLRADDADAVQRYATSLIKGQYDQARQETDPLVMRRYLETLMTDPQAAQRFVIDHTGNGLGVGASAGLFGSAVNAEHEKHFRKQPEVKDALEAVSDRLSTTGDPILDALISVDMNAIKSEAMTEFLLRLSSFTGPDGLMTPQVREMIPRLRDQVVATHRSRLKGLMTKQGQAGVGVPLTTSVWQVVREWQLMLQRGTPKYEADAFFGRELARHTALAAPEDQIANQAAIAAELAEALSALGLGLQEPGGAP